MEDGDAFQAALENMYQRREEWLRVNHNRSLPFGDAMFDRWERARRLGFGDKASIYNSTMVLGEVTVGHDTWVGPYCVLDGSGGGLIIGAFCSISAGVHIYTHDTVLWALSGGRAEARRAAVRIGDCCHIGAQAVIAAGVSIGAQAVVGANSFVNKDVANNAVVAGSPARLIGRVLVDEAGGISIAYGEK